MNLFLQILRMVRMDRRGGTWKLLGSVVYAHRQVGIIPSCPVSKKQARFETEYNSFLILYAKKE